MSQQPVLIGGEWITSQGTSTFTAVNPATGESSAESYPVSPWSEIEQAIEHAAAAYKITSQLPAEKIASFLERFAERLLARKAEIVAKAHWETALPVEPRLSSGEFPRTINQLQQAAAAARSGSWALPTIDTANNIRSQMGPLGPVVVFGPNNFPFAYNGIAGGDFAAAIAAGNPVIAKGHPSHPATTQILAEEAQLAAQETGMPTGIVQMIYRTSHADGARLVSHKLMAATGYTGGRSTGLALKDAADKAGKPIYLELSSINPVVILPGALTERAGKVAEEFAGSCLMGAGQFCTNPGLVLLLAGAATEAFLKDVAARFAAAPVGTLLGPGVAKSLAAGVDTLRQHGAELLTGGEAGGGRGACYKNTLLRVTAQQFLADAEALQTEAFGNASLIVVADTPEQLCEVLEELEGNLTGCIYSATTGADDALYVQVAPAVRQRVGRLLNDKMPTGVAVSAAMNHGGPYPATGHPGFTAVGFPASVRRFAALHCYDAVREARLPVSLRNANPGGTWRLINGEWTTGDVPV